MTVQEAIRDAERILPGVPAPEGKEDSRWQAIIAIGDFVRTDPYPVWEFVARWGTHKDDDLRTAIATCLLEHLLEHHFESIFPLLEGAVRNSSTMRDTFLGCSQFGKSLEHANAHRWKCLREEGAAK